MKQPENKILKPQFIYLGFIIIAFILYGNTLNFGFVLDDAVYIKSHAAVQKGFNGIDEIFTEGSTFGYSKIEGKQPYRPITLTSFALMKWLFHNAPFLERFINIFLYGIIACVLFNLLNIWLKNSHLYAKLICVLLFLVHPIHTEVVANIKSRDEIFALLFGLTSLLFAHQYFRNFKAGKLVLSSLFFALAIFSKENGILFLAIIPLSIYFFESKNLKQVVKSILPFLIITVVFVLIRNAVIGADNEDFKEDILNNVLVGAKTFEQKSATISSLLGKYFELLFKPYPLSWDYSFNQLPVVSWNSVYAILSLVIHLILIGYALSRFRKKDIFSFLILFYFISISIYTNIFFLNGATLAERFLFMPSVAFCIAIPMLIFKLFSFDVKAFSGSKRYAIFIFFGLIFLIFSTLTINRNNDWESDFKLFESGVEAAPNSSKTHSGFAYELNALADKSSEVEKKNELRQRAENEYLTSLKIYPKNTLALQNLGNLYYVENKPQKAIEYYLKLLEITPNNPNIISNIGTMYYKMGMINEAKTYFKRYIGFEPTDAEVLNYLGIIYFTEKNYPEARKYFSKLVEINANNANALGNIAATYQREKDYNNAVLYYERSLQIDPNDVNFRNNLNAIKNYLSRQKPK